MTNYERIKAMSVEEMVDRIYDDASIEYCNNSKECANLLGLNLITDSMCKACLRKWLESEVQDDKL